MAFTKINLQPGDQLMIVGHDGKILSVVGTEDAPTVSFDGVQMIADVAPVAVAAPWRRLHERR